MRPSLIIGIGGTGIAIGHALKYFIHTFLPENERNNFKFVFIDNDKTQFDNTRTKHITEVGDFTNEIIKISEYHPFEPYQKLKAKAEENKPLDPVYGELYEWYDTTLPVQANLQDRGLAANRMLGRMCGYIFYDKIAQGIKYGSDQLRKICQDANIEIKNDAINVYIITSNSGGTGSSLFFDISTMVDNEFNNNYFQVPKTLVLVSPNYYLEQKKAKGIKEDNPDYQNIQINSWAFIKECEFFINNFTKDRQLQAKYFSKPNILKGAIGSNTIFAPFTAAWLFDNNTLKNKKISNEKFFNSIGEILFYTLISSSNEKFNSEVTVNTFIQKKKNDDKTFSVENINLDQYISLGIKVLRYPKEEFEKYFKVRYVYEIFKKLLNRNPTETKIETKAIEFVSEAFTDSKNSILKNTAFKAFDENVRAKPDTSSIRFKEDYVDNSLGLFKEEGSENFKDEVELKGEFSRHDTGLEIFSRKVEETYQDLSRTNLIAAFNDRYQERPNIASDMIREKLWEKAYDVIAEEGYYGIVGVTDQAYTIKGYCEIIREKLIVLYTQTAKEFIQMDEKISQKKKDIEDLRERIVKKSKAMIGTKKVTTAESEVGQYIDKLKEYRETIIEKYYLIVKQEILYHFAVGDAAGAILRGSKNENKLASDTELTKYEKQINLRIGTSVKIDDTNRTSLMREFDNPDRDSYTIKNNYVIHLTSEFRESDKDVFTTYLPFQLIDLLDEYGWKKDNELNKIFWSDIVINKKEIDNIIEGNEKNSWRYKFACLSDSSEQKKPLKDIIEEIKKRLEEYFKTKYINNQNCNIGENLSKSIADIINDLDKDKKNNLLEMVKNIDYPIQAANLANLSEAGPYYNVNDDLAGFIEGTFNPPDKSFIIKHPKLDINKLVVVLYKRGLSYKNLAGNEKNLAIFSDRDKNVYRPFLHKRWNEYVYGPWDDKKISGEERIQVKIDRNIKEFTFRELISFFTGLDLVLNISTELNSIIFNEKSDLKRSIIYYDQESSKFDYVRKVTIDRNYKIKIDAGRTNENIIELALSQNSDAFNIDDEFKNFLSFNDVSKILSNDQEFRKSIGVFLTAISKHKSDVSTALKNNLSKLKTDFKSLSKFLTDLSKNDTNIKISKEDLDFAYNFDDKMIELLKDLFGIK